MNLTHSLRIFVRVAELSSFSAAAEHQGLPRTTASAAVREAENMLGTRLHHPPRTADARWLCGLGARARPAGRCG